MGITGGRVHCEGGIAAVIGASITGGGIHGDPLGSALAEYVIEGLQFGVPCLRLAFAPTDRGDLGSLVGDDLIVRVIEALSRVGSLVDNLSGFRRHSCYHLDVQVDLNRSRTGRAVESIHQNIGDTRIAEIVLLKILSNIAAWVAIQLKDRYRLVAPLDPCLQEWRGIIGAIEFCWHIASTRSKMGLSMRGVRLITKSGPGFPMSWAGEVIERVHMYTVIETADRSDDR